MLSKEFKDALKKEFEKAKSVDETVEMLNELRSILQKEHSPVKQNPVEHVRLIHIDNVRPNEYNPNVVANNEMHLLYTSISHDGYTQPVVAIYDEEKKAYVVVDGFHRFSVMRFNDDIRELNKGYLPVVVIDKDINDRMASTIRHNRARGKHQVTGMSEIVFGMLTNGWEDADICNELGMEPEELSRLKHITGFSKLFEDTEYSLAWESEGQVKLRKEWQEKHGERTDYQKLVEKAKSDDEAQKNKA